MTTYNLKDRPIFPEAGSAIASHSPQADAILHHPITIMRGFSPHSHVILEDFPFDEKQRLGKHIDVFHPPRATTGDLI